MRFWRVDWIGVLHMLRQCNGTWIFTLIRMSIFLFGERNLVGGVCVSAITMLVQYVLFWESFNAEFIICTHLLLDKYSLDCLIWDFFVGSFYFRVFLLIREMWLKKIIGKYVRSIMNKQNKTFFNHCNIQKSSVFALIVNHIIYTL